MFFYRFQFQKWSVYDLANTHLALIEGRSRGSRTQTRKNTLKVATSRTLTVFEYCIAKETKLLHSIMKQFPFSRGAYILFDVIGRLSWGRSEFRPLPGDPPFILGAPLPSTRSAPWNVWHNGGKGKRGTQTIASQEGSTSRLKRTQSRPDIVVGAGAKDDAVISGKNSKSSGTSGIGSAGSERGLDLPLWN